MKNDNKTDMERKVTGCGLTALGFIVAGLIGLVAGVVYVLFMFGSWIGGQ